MTLGKAVLGLGSSTTTGLLQMVEGVDKVANTLKLAVNRSKANIGNLTQFTQMLQHQLANFIAGDLPLTALLNLSFDVADNTLLLLGGEACLLAGAHNATQQLGTIKGLALTVALENP